MSDWDRLLQLVPYVGLPGAMALSLVYAIAKGWMVPGWLYREEKSRAERWERRALENLELARDAVTVADATVRNAVARKEGKRP